MPKNIVILLDGTSNQISDHRSNVLRFYGILAKQPDQLVYYDPGVGTFGKNGVISHWQNKFYEIWGLATGWGMDDNVKEAYRFLVENYSAGRAGELRPGPTDRDTISIIGFSRGAYTARVLAGFINAFGLMDRRNLNLLDYAYRAYKGGDENAQRGDPSLSEVRLFERMLRPDRPPIRMLGLFDTVASVLERGRKGWRFRALPFTKVNPSVQSVFHALAIDERRRMFPPMMWEENQPYRGGPLDGLPAVPQEVQQVWFPGYHADIGGGYPEKDSALCKVPLRWMVEKARGCGLVFNEPAIRSLVLGEPDGGKYVRPKALGHRKSSMRGAWPLFQLVPRRKQAEAKEPSLFGLTFPFLQRRYVPPRAKLHRAFQDRQRAFGFWPKNAPDDYELVD